MEPFQLVCQSCAAKLKVKNRSAIGQRLACPRCREVIHVEAPEGHDLGDSLTGTGSFDEMDMDSILQNQPPKPRKPKTIPTTPPRPRQSQIATGQTSATPPRPRQPKTSQPQPPVKQPQNPELAPGQEWVNPATKKKQRLVLMIMAAVGSLLVIVALCFAALNWSSTATPEVAKVSDDDPVKVAPKAEPVKKPESDLDPAPPIDDAALPADPSEELPTEVVSDTPPAIGDVPPAIEDTPPAIGDAPPIAGISDAPPKMPDKKANMDGFGDTTASDANAKPIESEMKEPDAKVAKAADDLEKLTAILSDSGTSLLEIQGAATDVRNELAVGTPKYFFERLLFDKTDITRRKDQTLLAVKYKQQPLQTVLNELSAISGLVLTIDVPTISTAGIDFNPKIDLLIENDSTAEVIRKVAESVDLVAVETDQGFWISLKEDDAVVKQSIDIAGLVDNEADAAEMIRVIKRIVYPNSWKNEAADANAALPIKPTGTISFADGKLELSNTAAVSREIQNLIDGVKAAARNDFESSPLLKPVTWIDAGSFANAYESKNSMRVPLAELFQTIASENKVQVMADWRALAQYDWTTGAMAPGTMEERTVGDIVKETSHGMGVSFYVADEKTVWFTSPEVANNIFLLKLYPVEKLAGGRLNTAQLNRILFDSLGTQLNQPGVTLELLSHQKLAIIRAPQALQRQIRAVFEAISK